LAALVSFAALAVALPLALSAPASATTMTPELSGVTRVTTAPGIAAALIGAGVTPKPANDSTRYRVASSDPLQVNYGFPIIGGDPDLATGSGDILHRGGITFESKTAKLDLRRYDIDLAAGKVVATQINGAAGKVAILDLDLSKLVVKSEFGATVLTNITVRLDPAAAGALNSTFGLALPTDGSLVFGKARVALR
jgi:hypothetical protein